MDVVSAVQLFAFFESYLLKKIVFARLSFLFLEQEVVGRSDLVVFVVLNISRCVFKIFTSEVVL